MLVSFQFYAIFGIVLPWTFLCVSSGKHVITFLLGTHPVLAVGLPGYMEGVGPSVILLVVDFIYPFKEAALGFVDICLLFFLIISILFISSLICIISFLLLTLCFVCFSLSNSNKQLGCLFEIFSCFLRKTRIAMNFPLRTAFAASQRFCMVVFSLSFVSSILFSFLISSLTHWFFSSIFFSPCSNSFLTSFPVVDF